MQSTGNVTLRALVMLVCLIVVPLVAVSGTSLPRLISDVLQGRKPRSLSTGHGQPGGVEVAGDTAQPAPTVRLPKREPDSAQAHAPTVVANESRELGPAPDVETAAPAPLWAPAAAPAAMGAPTSPAAKVDPPSGRLRRDHAGVSPRSVIPPAVDARRRGPEKPDDRAANGDSDGRFTAIQRRLRELGATYYLLESGGDRGEQFRFYCQMTATGDGPRTPHFEATSGDPIVAMQNVLRQVEGWRGFR